MVLDQSTGALYCVPLESDEYRMPCEGRLSVYRSRDRGDSWEPLREGLPQENAYMGVLRSALATDGRGNLCLGTTSGQLYTSVDGGNRWRAVNTTLPRVLSISSFIEE